MKIKNGEQLYIIRKYVAAKSAAQAISLDKKTPVMDVWVDEDFKKTQAGPSAIGFIDYRCDNA